MDVSDEGPLINENSNGLSHLLTEGEFNSVDAVGVDESSASNQGFLNAVELSTGSVGDYLENNTDSFNAESFDVGDNAVTFPSDSLNNVLSDGDSRLSDAAYKSGMETDADVTLVNTDHVIDLDADDDSKIEQLEGEIDHIDEAEEGTTIEEDAGDVVGSENVKLNIESDDIKLNEDSESVKPSKENHDTCNDESELAKPNYVSQHSKATEEDLTDDGHKVLVVKDSQSQPTIQTDDLESKSNDGSIKEVSSDVGGAEETEVVSEDELPTVEKPSVKDAENVSDDELPGPKPAELPADTEVSSLIMPALDCMTLGNL